MRPRIFVTQPVARSAVTRLRKAARVTVHPDASHILSRKGLLAGVRRCDILFSLLHDRVDREVIAANPQLRAIASQSLTPDNIDVAEATRRGIAVTVVPRIVAEATADINFGLMLMVARRMIEGDRLVRQGRFPGSQSNYLAGAAVCGKTIGLVGGGGRIGRAVARRARGFDMRVLYWSPARKPESLERECEMTYVPLERLLAESDFVSIHSPLTPQTRHQIGSRELARMKRSAFLINTARGAIVDEAALARALQKGRIAGAGLDVFENEPKVTPALLKMKNVVMTPHLGSAVLELREQMANIVVDNILALIAGTTPPNCVNPEVLGGTANRSISSKALARKRRPRRQHSKSLRHPTA
jgi:glyoxylate reductase